jgi:hypothetical protein
VSGTWTACRTATAAVSGSVCGESAPVPAWAVGVVMLTGHRPCPPRLDAAVAFGSSGSGPLPGRAPHQLLCPRCCRKDHPCPRWWPACGRRPDAPSGPEIAADTGLPRGPDTSRPDGGRSGSSRRSIRRSLVTTFSTLPSRPALRPGSATTAIGAPALPSRQATRLPQRLQKVVTLASRFGHARG